MHIHMCVWTISTWDKGSTRKEQELEHSKVINTSKILNNLITKKKKEKTRGVFGCLHENELYYLQSI